MHRKINVSVIVVHYQVETVLFECLASIKCSKTKNSHEVIVIDNGSLPGFSQRLKKSYPSTHYIQAKKNLGYGGGNNLGAKHAKGTTLFFLNPDTKVMPGCIDFLFDFLQKNEHAGIVAPTLLHPDLTVFDQQGALTLTPLRAIAAHSIFHRLWPNNPISKKFWLQGVSKNLDRKVEVVPGTAFALRRSDFVKLGGFDETFFLYFEEYDFCKRMIQLQKEIWMLGSAQVIHSWGATTQGVSLKKVYSDSLNHYLVKHYGTILGSLTYWITQISKIHLLFILLVLGLMVWFNFWSDG